LPAGAPPPIDPRAGATPRRVAARPRASRATVAHDRFAVLDVKVGMAVEVAGFTCLKPAATDDDRHCVKFLDTRCSGRPANIGTLRYGETAPLGCFLDHSSQGTYLDGKLLQVPNTGSREDADKAKDPTRMPLVHVHLVGTRSSPSKIYRIRYLFALDELTPDSKLSKALTAKYGEPSYKNPPNDMRWKAEDTSLRATCQTQYCDVTVEDQAFAELENRKQQEADGRARRANAPAPKL
jgi:hypothetical protein